MQKIAIIGAHGVGKTQLCRRLWGYCHQKKYSAELVEEVVRQCPIPIHEKQTNATTLWIISKQITMELEAEYRNPDFVICDRSILDPIVYLTSVNPEDLNPDVVEFAEAYSKTYDKLYLVRPTNSRIESDGYRNTDAEFQYAINAIFSSWLAARCHFIDASDIFADTEDRLCKRIIGE